MAGDGVPIVLLADRGTAGGYTKIATVIGPDILKLAQAALKAGVSINPGPEWSSNKAYAKNRMRLCFANPDPETIKEGVAVLAELVERAAASLPGWDCDIVESHHVHKKDAPSGTALTLGQAAGSAGQAVRYASLRAGDIVGEHMVQFTGLGERIELTHRATHRDIFARGALHVARSLVGRPPGAYRVRDLLD